MIGDGLHEVLREGMRALFLGAIPLAASVIVASFVGTILQGAMNLRDEAVMYGVRAVVFLLVLGVTLEATSSGVVDLFSQVLR